MVSQDKPSQCQCQLRVLSANFIWNVFVQKKISLHDKYQRLSAKTCQLSRHQYSSIRNIKSFKQWSSQKNFSSYLYLFLGYIGHLASRHSEVLTEPSPVITRTETEFDPDMLSLPALADMKQETDPEQAIPKSSVQNHQAPAHKHTAIKTTESKKSSKGSKGNLLLLVVIKNLRVF